MSTNIPVMIMPGLSWPAVLNTIQNDNSEINFLATSALGSLQTEANNPAILDVGFSIGSHLVKFDKYASRLIGVVHNVEFLEESVVECIKNHCDARFYLSSDPEIRNISGVQLVTVLGTAFSQIASTDAKARECISLWKSMLSENGMMIIETGAKPVILDEPHILHNPDGSISTISQALDSRGGDTNQLKEVLTHETAFEDERISVRNVRIFHEWGEGEFSRICRSCGFTNIELIEHNGKKYIFAYRKSPLPERKDLWQTNN